MASVVSLNTNFLNINKIMIKANELRVGNLVYDLNDISKITCIEEERVSTNTGLFNYTELNDIQGIPLTKDWFLRFGAKIISKNTLQHDRFKIYFVDKYNFWYVNDFRTNVYFTKIEFVHEWQNFVFVVNGEELVFSSTEP